MIIIRCDASPQIGAGHLVRCAQLAEALRSLGHSTLLAGHLPADPPAALIASFDQIVSRPEPGGRNETAEPLLRLAEQWQARALVLDLLQAPITLLQGLGGAGLPWLQFAPTADVPLMGDLVYCANAAADPETFRRHRRGPEPVWLIGTQFAIMRPQFRLRTRPQMDRAVRRALVSFGGGSDRGAYLRLLPVLLDAMPSDWMLCCVCSSQSPDLDAVRAYAGQHRDRMEIHVDAPDMADLMLASDLGILAAGTTTLEAAACKLPMLLIAIAENQVLPALAWQERGCARFLGRLAELDMPSLRGAVEQACTQSARQSMSRALETEGVDGCGSARVASAVDAVIRARAPGREMRI